MRAALALLLLAAAPAQPALLLEPDPGSYKRLQPRSVSASSFLQNGWNAYEQNFLPLYVADDDPATAWVEGAQGPGVGESLVWMGPALQKARAYRVFVRAGYQKSKALFAANARPRKVRLEPVRPGEVAPVPAGQAVEVELADQVGWQRIELPTEARVAGVRLTVLSVYPGSQYEDLGLSDVRVYVDGDDPYKPELEAAAAEQIRAFVADRKKLAAQGPKPGLQLSPAYPAKGLYKHPLKGPELAKLLASSAGLLAATGQSAKEAAEAAAAASAAFDALPQEGAPQGFRPVALQLNPSLASTAHQAMPASQEVDWHLPALAPLFDARDFTAYEAADPLPALKAEVAAVQALRKRDETACTERCQRLEKRMPLAFSGDCDCAGHCRSQCQLDFQKSLSNVANHHVYVEGGLAAPTALYESQLIGHSGRMDDYVERRDTLIVYQEGRAQVVVTRAHFVKGHGQDLLAVHVLRWERGLNNGERLGSVTSFVAHDEADWNDIQREAEVWRFTAA